MKSAPAPQAAATAPPSRLLVGLGFATIYLVWGSTYLGIRVAVATIPPFLLGGSRYLLAGIALHLFLRARGVRVPAHTKLKEDIVIGGLLLLGGNGLVTWAQQFLPSGATALLFGATPVVFALLEWTLPPHRRPDRPTAVGMAAGTMGIVLLQQPDGITTGTYSVAALLALLAASLCWAFGSLRSRTHGGGNPFMSASIQMMAGGAMQLGAAAALGEWRHFNPAAVTPASAIAWAYLVLFGSLLSFGTYIWLLRVSTPAKVSTYAYVNPVIALLLGWAVLGEQVTPTMLAATSTIVTAVILINHQRG